MRFRLRGLSLGNKIGGGIAGQTMGVPGVRLPGTRTTEEGFTVPQERWSEKRERQYEHIRASVMKRGRSDGVAEEIAARTVNKVRAQSGESKSASTVSADDMSPNRRGGLRSHAGSSGRTFKHLYEEARRGGIEGRSKMNKNALQRAVDKK